MLPIGSKAPDFKIKLHSGEIFRLRDISGKSNLVVSFFHDTIEKKEQQDVSLFFEHLQKIQELGTSVLIICPGNIGAQQKVLEHFHLKILIGSDPTLEVCRNYRVFWLRGVGLREVTYIIDKKGTVRSVLKHHLVTKKTWDQVLRLLHELEGDQRTPK